MSENKGMAYKGGGYLPIEEVSIPILDPAFTKSDVVFDAVSVSSSSFFRLDDHMRRFYASCEYVRMTPPVTDDEIRHILAQCVDRAGLTASVVYMLCTRGRYAGGVAFGDPTTCENDFIAYAVPYYYVVPKERVETGTHLWIADTRRAPDSAINQRVKNFNRMDLTRAQFEAFDAGADAPLLLSTEGYVTEGPGFNVWIVKDGKAYTPGDNLLEGITRLATFDLCKEAGLEPDTANLAPEDLYSADDAFITSTAGGLIPVTRINDRTVGNGAPGIASCQLRDRYWQKRTEGWHATPVAELLAEPMTVAAG